MLYGVKPGKTANFICKVKCRYRKIWDNGILRFFSLLFLICTICRLLALDCFALAALDPCALPWRKLLGPENENTAKSRTASWSKIESIGRKVSIQKENPVLCQIEVPDVEKENHL